MTATIPAQATLPIGEQGVALAMRIKAARDQKKALDAQEAADKAALVALMGDATVGTFHGITVVTIKTQSRSGTDSKKLAELFPEAFQATRTEVSFPRIDVK